MSIADIKYKELIKDIYENGSWDSDKEVRAKYADGTPAYCKSVFGKQIIFEEDELPLLTCKKVFTKTAIKEMILFWIKSILCASVTTASNRLPILYAFSLSPPNSGSNPNSCPNAVSVELEQ